MESGSSGSDSDSKFKYRDTSCYQSSRRYQKSKGCFDTKSVAIADFIDRVPFTHFVTLDPYKEISVTGLKGQVKQIINRIEKHIKAPVSYVVGYEPFPQVNCHGCFCSAGRLTTETISSALLKQFDYDIQEIYSKDVLPYVLKTVNVDGDWDFGNLDYYLKTPVNRKDRKRMARHNERLSHA